MGTREIRGDKTIYLQLDRYLVLSPNQLNSLPKRRGSVEMLIQEPIVCLGCGVIQHYTCFLWLSNDPLRKSGMTAELHHAREN